MNKKHNGKFTVFDGYYHGYNIKLAEGKKIAKTWHFAEDFWPDSHYSICTFEFPWHGAGTKLKFRQTGIPEEKVKTVSNGWRLYYWNPIKAY